MIYFVLHKREKLNDEDRVECVTCGHEKCRCANTVCDTSKKRVRNAEDMSLRKRQRTTVDVSVETLRNINEVWKVHLPFRYGTPVSGDAVGYVVKVYDQHQLLGLYQIVKDQKRVVLRKVARANSGFIYDVHDDYWNAYQEQVNGFIDTCHGRMYRKPLYKYTTYKEINATFESNGCLQPPKYMKGYCSEVTKDEVDRISTENGEDRLTQ